MNKFALFLKATLLDPFIHSFQRFTDTIVLSIVLVIAGIINLETGRAIIFLNDMLSYLWLAVPLLVFKTIIVERLKLRSSWKYILLAVTLFVVLGLFLIMRYALETPSSVYSFRMAVAWIIAVILPLLARHFPKREGFAQYLIFLLTKFFVTIFYSAVLYGGLFGILASIEGLFRANLGMYIYIDLFIAIIGLVAVPVFLGYFPTIDQVIGDADFHKIWKTVFAFIIIPLLMVFSLILVVYVAFSSINPVYYGTVYLIAALISSFLSLAMIFFLDAYEGEYPHVRFFNKIWPYVNLALLAGYAYELIRALISDGFTLGNNIYLYLGIAVLALTIIRLIKKPMRLGHGQIIGTTAIVSGVTMAFIPFINILGLATFSLNSRFEKMLSQYGMLENGEIVHATTELSQDAKVEISMFVQSDLSDIGYNRVRCLPDDFTIMDFAEVFGFELTSNVGDLHIISYYSDDDDIDFSLIDIAGYTDFLLINNLANEETSFGIYSHITNVHSDVWSLSKNDVLYLEIDMSIVLEDFNTRFDDDNKYELDIYTELKYTPQDESYDLYFKYIGGQYHAASDVYDVDSACFYIGIK